MNQINETFYKTLNQERASFILKKVKEFKGDENRFKAEARRVSSLIISNGLLPTLAFLKSKEERKPVYDIIAQWLKHKGLCKNDALEELLNSDAVKLRLATMEALELANWLKRIVEIEIRE
ncbi:MAG: type III-B CRISPR module-associated protein Cmr5 [candidate division WOR-3 bacterium]